MQTRINKQKAVADKVLAKLELLDTYCIVAGGAPRDWYLGKPATDIDVYLHFPHVPYMRQRKLLEVLEFPIKSVHENWIIPELYEGNKCVKHLYNTEVDGEKVQIMFMSKPTFTCVVDTFPISISKAWYKNQQIKLTEDFKNSIKHKIIWKTVDNYSEDNKYLLKIKDKFSDYKYVTVEEANNIIKEANKDKLIKDLKFELDTVRTVHRDTTEKLKEQITELEAKNRELRIKLRSTTNNFFDTY